MVLLHSICTYLCRAYESVYFLYSFSYFVCVFSLLDVHSLVHSCILGILCSTGIWAVYLLFCIYTYMYRRHPWRFTVTLLLCKLWRHITTCRISQELKFGVRICFEDGRNYLISDLYVNVFIMKSFKV